MLAYLPCERPVEVRHVAVAGWRIDELRVHEIVAPIEISEPVEIVLGQTRECLGGAVWLCGATALSLLASATAAS